MKRPDHGASPVAELKRKAFRTTLAAVRQFDEVGILESGKPLRQTGVLLKNFLDRPRNTFFGTACFYGSKICFLFSPLSAISCALLLNPVFLSQAVSGRRKASQKLHLQSRPTL